MKKVQPTKIIFVLDETGSMNSVLHETIEGFNKYVSELKTSKLPMTMSLIKFNSEKISHDYQDVDVKEVRLLSTETYKPRDMTPLMDAVGHAIAEADAFVVAQKEANHLLPKLLIVVQTDGQENSSHEYTREQIVNLVQERQEQGWTFVFLGADQNAWHNAKQYGFLDTNTVSYLSADTKHTYGRVAAATVAYAASAANNTDSFFEETTS